MAESKISELKRSKTNRLIAGVCGGLGEYLDIDPTIIRIGFIILTIAGGSGVLAYLLLWLVMPSASQKGTDTVRENAAEIKEKAKEISHEIGFNTERKSRRGIGAIFLIALGVLFLLHNLGILSWFDFGRY